MERARILPWLLIFGILSILQFLIFGFPSRKVWNENDLPQTSLASQELSSLRARLIESETENKHFRADVTKLIGQSTSLTSACPPCALCPLSPPVPPPPPPPQPQITHTSANCVSIEAAIERYVSYMGSLLARNEKNDWYIGRYDAIVVAPMLRPLFDGVTPQLIIDVGANTGDTAADFVPIYTEVDCMRYQKRRPPTGPHDDCHLSPLSVISYEPVPENFAILKLRGDEEGWSDAGWRAYQVATTSPQVIADSGSSKESGHGTLKFFARFGADGKMVGGDQQGGLVQAAVQSSTFVLVDAWTLDEHLKSIGEISTSILLLKIDVEGSDGSVLRGAEGLLRSHRARFVVFEYNSKWNYPGGDTLAGISKWMEQLRYVCFWITPDGFVPLSGKFWHPSYEFWTWSNVLCIREGDIQGNALVTYYNTIKQTLPTETLRFLDLVSSVTLADPILVSESKHSRSSFQSGSFEAHGKRYPTKLLQIGAEEVGQLYHDSFDTVIMQNVLEHVQDAYAVLESMYNAKKVGGVVVFWEPMYGNQWSGWVGPQGQELLIDMNLPLQLEVASPNWNDLQVRDSIRSRAFDFTAHPIRVDPSVFDYFASLFEPIMLKRVPGRRGYDSIILIGRKKVACAQPYF